MDATTAVALERETILAQGVSFEDYLNGKYGVHTEWISGVVIAMSPVSIAHNRLRDFLSDVFRVLLDLTGGGEVFTDPVVMRPTPDSPARQPDLFVVLPDRAAHILPNVVACAAHLVVEIVSPESFARDRGVKFEEYERGGVDEYWVIDPKRREALFYVRDAEGTFQPRMLTGDVYTSVVLPKLRLPISQLWAEKFPSTREVVQWVESLLEGEQ